MAQVDLSKYTNSWYSPGRSVWIRGLWFFAGLPVLRAAWLPFSCFRGVLLRVFGAKVGSGVVIKPGVRVKYPWLLEIGDHCWIGEDVWIDNLAPVRLGESVCVSQGAYLCTGNHDWSDPAFGLLVSPISMGDGAWVGAKSVICPGVKIGTGSVTAAGSVVNGNLEPFMIYRGNPATPVKSRAVRAPGNGVALW